MRPCPDAKEAKARKHRDVLKLSKQALAEGAALWACVLAVPAGRWGTMLVRLALIVDAKGQLTRPAVSVSIEPLF